MSRHCEFHNCLCDREGCESEGCLARQEADEIEHATAEMRETIASLTSGRDALRQELETTLSVVQEIQREVPRPDYTVPARLCSRLIVRLVDVIEGWRQIEATDPPQPPRESR